MMHHKSAHTKPSRAHGREALPAECGCGPFLEQKLPRDPLQCQHLRQHILVRNNSAQSTWDTCHTAPLPPGDIHESVLPSRGVHWGMHDSRGVVHAISQVAMLQQ